MDTMDLDMMRTRARWEEAVSKSLETIATTSHDSDKAILTVVEALVSKIIELQRRVDMLEGRSK